MIACMNANPCCQAFYPVMSEVFFLLEHSLIANKRQEVGIIFFSFWLATSG